MQRRVAGEQVEPAANEMARLDFAQQRAYPGVPGQGLEHELNGAPTGQSKAAGFVRGHAVGHGLARRLRHAQAPRAVDDVVFDAAAGHRADDEAVIADREHRAFGPRRTPPRLHHRDQQDGPSFINPCRTVFQDIQIDAIHAESLLRMHFFAALEPDAAT